MREMNRLEDHEIGILNHLLKKEIDKCLAVGPYKDVDKERIDTLYHIKYVLNHT